jgi:hypothetical protein
VRTLCELNLKVGTHTPGRLRKFFRRRRRVLIRWYFFGGILILKTFWRCKTGRDDIYHYYGWRALNKNEASMPVEKPTYGWHTHLRFQRERGQLVHDAGPHELRAHARFFPKEVHHRIHQRPREFQLVKGRINLIDTTFID